MLVVKVGGSEGVNLDTFAADSAEVVRSGQRVVIVHGASHATTTLAAALGHPAQFISSPSGHSSRRTDRRTLEIFQLACRGVMNQQLVEKLLRNGVNAVGISGLDARLWEGKRKDAIRAVEDGVVRIIRDDFSGTVERVNTRLITTLLDAGFTPVISPPAISTEGDPINVDADRAAAQTAAALKAETLLLLSNVMGLLRSFPDEATLISRIAKHEIDGAVQLAGGRMKNKVMAAGEAVRAGVMRAVIADARSAAPIRRALAGEGTVIS